MNDPNWQQLLIGSHPRLFLRSYRGLSVAPGYPLCPSGWREVVATMVNRVACSANGYPVHFTQIAQRCGILSISWCTTARLPTRLEHAIDEAIALAEARSACTCATCGDPGRLHCTGGLLLPICPAHIRDVSVPAFTHADQVYLVRELGRDDASIIRRRKYDRVRDVFTVVDPSTDIE